MTTAPDRRWAPFHLEDGQLAVEGLVLAELVEGLATPGAWVVSSAALAEAVARGRKAAAGGGAEEAPFSVSVGQLGAPEVLGLVCGAQGMARVRSSHELDLALAAGLPPARLIATGAAKDDGFVKDALSRGVGVVEAGDDAEAGNVARIAAMLGVPVPPSEEVPPDLPRDVLTGTGGLLARALRGAPRVVLDADWPGRREHGAPVLLPLRPAAEQAATVEFLEREGAPVTRAAVSLMGPLSRGDWVVLPTGWAAAARPVDLAHPELPTVLVTGSSWRFLEHRPLPPRL